MSRSCAVLKNHFTIPALLSHLPQVTAIGTEFATYVVPSAQGISLCVPRLAKKPYQVDFTSEHMTYRSAKSLQQNELIVRACRIKSLAQPCTVVDATAGFGRDAYILAANGFEVCVVERNPVVAVLLAQGIAHIDDRAIKARLTLMHEDSQSYLKKLSMTNNKPEIIYLDPMFMVKRQAKVKKALQILQVLLQDDIDDSALLLPLALQAAKQRVVVKRAIDAPALNNLTPSFHFLGKHTRFDVYTV